MPMNDTVGGIVEIGSEAELAAIAGSLCVVSSLTPGERALAHSARISAPCPRAARALILAGGDPLGEAFIQLRSGPERRKSGAVYTPSSIVARMIAWARDEGVPARIVDPGAGSGRFLLTAAREWPQASLVACELDPLAALILRANAHVLGLSHRLELFVGDYRELALPPCKGRTLFIGNPPYLRHHGIEKRWKRWFADASLGFGFKASKLAGLHAHFFLRTRQLARKGDYGAFVTSAEWLDVNYGGVIREMLGNGLGGTALQVIDPEALPFADTMTTAAISCFTVGSHAPGMTVRKIRRLSDEADEGERRTVDWSELRAAPRWSIFFRKGARRAGALRIGDLFRVHRGQVTGANKVWIEGAFPGPLPERLLLPTVTRARELFAADGLLSRSPGQLRRVLFLPADLGGLSADERQQVVAFLDWAKAQGAHETFTARHRAPWWTVPLKAPPPILCSYMARRAPTFALNDVGARYINIALGLYPKEPLTDAALRATAAYLRENVCMSEGRTYAGGLVKFEPRELEAVALPRIEDLIDWHAGRERKLETLPAAAMAGMA
jgi:adenine-specific DNA-methyltransferase